MKLILALTALPVASALMAPAPKAAASTLAAAPVSEWAGKTAPMGFFDPLSLSKDADAGRARFYREAELKHGRVAMLASTGFLFQEHFHFGSGPFAGIDSPSYVSFEQGWLAGGYWLALAVAAGNLEAASVECFEPLDFTDGKGLLHPDNEKLQFRVKEDHVAGDYGFDPLGLKPSGKDLVNMQTKELNNGRLAMIGIAGMVAQELVTHAKI